VETKLGHKFDNRGRIELVIQWFEECSEPDNDLAEYLRPYRDEAIETLLNCLVNDKRLTRGFRQTEIIRMEPIAVNEVAFSTLQKLIDVEIPYESAGERSAEGLRALAEEIRMHLKQQHNSARAK
jgi:hypothetical protein